MTRLIFRPITFVALTLIFMFGMAPARALEGLKVYRGVLVLEGTIEAGDFDKVRGFLGNKSNFDKIRSGVFVASPGGNVIEAIKIGRLIRALRLGTDAPSGPPTGVPRFGQSLIASGNLVNPRMNYQCASACFFIYVAGVYRSLGWVGRLGIHRPRQLESDLKKLDIDQTLNLNWRVRGLVQKYLEAMNIPDKYVGLMYAVPPKEVHWITQNEFDSDIAGFVPEVKQWLSNKCSLQTKSLTAEIESCWMRFETELSNEGWNAVFADKGRGAAGSL